MIWKRNVFPIVCILTAGVYCSEDCVKNGISLAVNRDPDRPYFDHDTPTNVTVQLGSRAHLACVVHERGDAAVSWVRRKDSHIISVGKYTFIADDRFHSLHWTDSDTWTLQIARARPADAGQYECQVSSEPKMCHLISLTVIVPKVRIITDRDGDVFVNYNSVVHLECEISGTIENPAFVFWFHDSNRLAPDTTNSQRISIADQRSSADLTRSVLTISGVGQADSGNYTCQPSSLPAVSTTLHVLNGELRAAMQDGVSGGFPSGPARQLWIFCSVVLLLQSTVMPK